jgi:release factor glutamine methyltransferase
MTIHNSLRYADQRLSLINESTTIIYSLLSHVLCLPQEYIWAHPDNKITREQFDLFSAYIERASNHEPLAYIIGEKEFYQLPFFVTQDTLIPRPESESIIDVASDFVHTRDAAINWSPVIVDVGTGSGCLAITLATIFPQATIYAIDLSTSALNVARRNAIRHKVSNCIFLNGSLLEPLQAVITSGSIDVIVANLPYISDTEFASLPLHIKQYEPELALRSGKDPDVLNRQLIQQAKDWLSPGGQLFYETTNGRVVTATRDELASNS